MDDYGRCTQNDWQYSIRLTNDCVINTIRPAVKYAQNESQVPGNVIIFNMAVLVINRGLKWVTFLSFLVIKNVSYGWIHNLKLQNDDRSHIMLTRTFGFLEDGTVTVNVTMFSFKPYVLSSITNTTFGFTLNKSRSPGLASYVENSPTCVLDKPDENESSVFFRFDLTAFKLIVERHGTDLHDLTITSTPRDLYPYQNGPEHGVASIVEGATPKTVSDVKQAKVNESSSAAQDRSEQAAAQDNSKQAAAQDSSKQAAAQDSSNQAAAEPAATTPVSPPKVNAPARRKRATVQEKAVVSDKKTQDKAVKPAQAPQAAANNKASVIYLQITESMEGSMHVYSTNFTVHFKTAKEEGLYNLFFHNCMKQTSWVNLSVHIVQDNNGNYLSADEMPIPALYFMFSVVFFILTAVWYSVLRKAEEGVFKIHYMMLVVVLFKAFSCLFHGVNMHMIQQTGIHVDAWAILWYIVYLMRGALMFVTILLIGAGWAFIKHVFTDREKKLFLVIIPMQILMNVAWVIVEESEQGDASYNTWNKIFIGVDLLCCFAILFPVVWSIRHLQEASKTDGKAAINLNKLKLFRHFYILVVAYIYFTRIIGYLLRITLPFRYGWMTDLFHEIFLLIFFVSTGYKFRPTMDNPYLQVPLDSDDEEEIEMDEVMTKTGNRDTVVRVNQGRSDSSTKTMVKQRESSHEYD
ncbi:hypothetical protein RRG08_030704 [Elysia crispata]|uniref:Protein GPR107 n=1 Tax=Elysia crispata TaxID=231223 RepID=A0AAE1CSG9_9GAST|nr:hypothetical protein RRG08_030704 [Elysia crispata]